MNRPLGRSLVATISIWATLSALPAWAQRQSGVQVTPDGRRTLISKDVNGERWAITRDLDDLTVTGNVFFPAGGDPLFVYCQQTGDAGDDLNFDCFGANKCGPES